MGTSKIFSQIRNQKQNQRYRQTSGCITVGRLVALYVPLRTPKSEGYPVEPSDFVKAAVFSCHPATSRRKSPDGRRGQAQEGGARKTFLH